MKRKKKKRQKYAQANEHTKGIQISISLSKGMLVDPYFLKGERFYKIRVVLRYLEPFLVLGLFISFFLPLLSLNRLSMSAYDLVRLDNFTTELSLLVLIPILSFCVIFISKFDKLKFFLSIFLGLLSFLLIEILIDKLKFDFLFHGFFMTLFFSILLIILPLYKIFNKETLLNKKKIAFNSKLLKPWLAFGLFASFFLPWLHVDTSYLSGFNLLLDENYREEYGIISTIPIFSMLLIGCYKFSMKLKLISFLTGITPYVMILILTYILEKNLLIYLSVGAYISLLFGLGLVFLSLRNSVKKFKYFF